MAQEQAQGQVDEVVVTGSRIVRNGFNASTPITVTTTEQLQQTTPSNIPDGLNKLPAFAGSRSQATLGNAGGANQGNFLNLRAFGIERTLVLLDGRRVPAANVAGNVDVNTLPQILVQKVDVVTGGASAVYGSDAVTGVVNFILDKQFTGLKGVVQGGVSSRNDAAQWRAGIAGGADVLERGHVIWSVDHFQNAGIKSKYDRELGDQIYQEVGGGTAANPFRRIANGRVSNTSFGGLITTGPYAGFAFAPDGSLFRFNAGTPTGNTNLASGGDGGYQIGGTLVASLRTDQAFGRFEYDFTDKVKGFMQVMGAESRIKFSSTNEARSAGGANAINIYSGNAFLPAEVQAAMTAGNVASFNLGRYNNDFGNAIRGDSLTSGITFTTGFEAQLTEKWRLDGFYTHGEGRVRLKSLNNVNNQRFYAAIDAVRAPNGTIVCRVTQTNPGLYPGCVPFNLFGDGRAGIAAINYILGTTQFQTTNRLDNVGTNLSGDLFELPAGPLSIAVGYEYRSQAMTQSTSDDPNTKIDLTGLRGPFTTGTQVWTRNVVAPTRGSNSVWEVNGEALVPLLKDVPFAQNLEANLAYRYTDYSTSGVAKTWKIGLNWRPVEDLRFRLVRSRDIRAPTLNDLYAGKSLSITGFTDLHTGVAGFTNGSSQGNKGLVPEIADTDIAGVVYQPRWLPRFSVSIDYYNINIDNAIGSVGGNNTAAQQECERSGGASSFCALYIRPLPFADRTAANYPTTIVTQPLNIAQTYTHGVDVEVGYNFDLSEMGNLDARLLIAHQPVIKSRSLPGAQLLNQAGAGGGGPGSANPAKDRVNFSLNYKLDKLQLNSNIRWMSKLRQSSNPTLVYLDADIPAYTYLDLSVSYDVGFREHSGTVFLTVQNVFDKQPPVFASTAFTGNPGFQYPIPNGYDIVGRYFTTGLRFKY